MQNTQLTIFGVVSSQTKPKPLIVVQENAGCGFADERWLCGSFRKVGHLKCKHVFLKILLLFNGSYFIICRHPFQVCAADGNRQWKSGDGWASAGKQGVFCLNPSHVLLSLACSSWILGQMSMEALCLFLRLCQCWCICLLLLSHFFLLLLHLLQMYVMEFLLDSKVLVNTNESTSNLKVGLFYLDNTITEY